MEKQPILLSGVKPTGIIHIGNYFGMIKPSVDSQGSTRSFIFIADLHALTSVTSKEVLQNQILNLIATYIACGVDVEKTVLYQQSALPEVAEICWIFNCMTTMPYLMRAHAFKDAEAKNKEINVGVFDYPLLMAADILIQQANIVPTGQDQKQHVEIARDTAEKFNRIYGDTFTLPESKIDESLKTIIGTDGQKMSKSYNNIIPLFATREELTKIVMAIPTDSKAVSDPKDPETDTIFGLYSLFVKDTSDLKKRYVEGGIGYKEAKDILIDAIDNYVAPMREKYFSLIENREALLEILRKGNEIARTHAEPTIKKVRANVGLTF